MYTKQNLIDSVNNEVRILKHLVEKIPADTEGYKPTEGQRTTLELLQYISGVVTAMAKSIYANDSTKFGEHMAHVANTTIANFAEVMDAQSKEFEAIVNQYTDEDLQTMINMYGQGEYTKGVYLTEFTLKLIASYKMQLFLYIKSSGNTSLGTTNLWGGMDMPPQQ